MKQQQLTFDKGITTVPSDALCSDNALELATNIIYHDSEHRVIQQPKRILDSGTNPIAGTLLFVHHVPTDTKNYICYGNCSTDQETHITTANLFYNGHIVEEGENHFVLTLRNDETPVVQAIGNMLIVKDSNGLHYFLWKNGVIPAEGSTPAQPGYKYLGQQIPFPQVQFKMGNDVQKQSSQKVTGMMDMVYDESVGVWISGVQYEAVYMQVAAGKLEEYNDAVVGLYSKNEEALNKDKAFATPFFASYALEMYDGSYIYQGAPQLMFPCVRQNTYAKFHDDEWLTLYTDGKELLYKADFDYSEWSDIVKDVVVFVTDGAHVYDTTGDQVETDAEGNMIPEKGHIAADETASLPYIILDYADTVENGAYTKKAFPDVGKRGLLGDNRRDPGTAYFYPLKRYSDGSDLEADKDIINQLKSLGLFYKIGSLGIRRNDSDYVSTAPIILPHTLENLTTQERMTNDFYSRCQLNSSIMKALNNRLHLANITRGFAPIETGIFPYEGPSDVDLRDPDNPVYEDSPISQVRVCISTPSGEKIIAKTLSPATNERLDLYFYYPDPRAKAVSLAGPNAVYKLEEHQSLNGAFYLHALPNEVVVTPANDPNTSVTGDDAAPENLPSELYVSEVNNPFVFRPQNAVQVGSGVILAIASLTTALSQGQFGQYPVIAFTNYGIWALSVTNEGVYASAKPMSREVLYGLNSVTETDGAVFFTSKKGLMLITGNEVRCVSQQLEGSLPIDFGTTSGSIPVDEILLNCQIAYDYRDSLLWLIYRKSGFEEFTLVYSIKSGAFAWVNINNNAFTNIVPDYPDTLLQESESFSPDVYSLFYRNSRDADGTTSGGTFIPNTYDANLFSRPLKLENALALKSIMQLRHIYVFTPPAEPVTPPADTTENPTEDPTDPTDPVDPENPEATEPTEPAEAPAAPAAPSIKLRLFASNNLHKWVELKSLRGMPWKYYKMQYTFEGLKATDTFAGTMAVTEERRTNKLR